jgi:hypothetical protein
VDTVTGGTSSALRISRAGILDMDHGCSEVRQKGARKRAGDNVGKFDDLQACECP